MDTARSLALKALLKVEENKAYSNLVLNSILSESNLNCKDKTLCSALFYGVLERKITLEYIISKYSKIPLKKISKEVLFILFIGIYQLKFMDRVPQSAAVNETVKLAKKTKNFSSTGFINGILRNFVRNNCNDYIDELTNENVKYLSVKYSCPKHLVKLWLRDYGEENTVGILNSFFKVPSFDIRVNTLKTNTTALAEILKSEGVVCEKINVCSDALTVKSTGQIENLNSFKSGLFHVQNLASQLCMNVLNLKPEQVLVDVCSAPGGKSFTAAEIMRNTGKIYSYDLYEHKVGLIKAGARRLGINIINADVKDAKTDKSEKEFADMVLCDVPCSGFGIIGRKPEIRYKPVDNFLELPKLQYEILCNAEKLLKKGGRLLYSTCTLNRKENNEIADKFLKEHTNYKPVEICIAGIKKNNFERGNQLTLLPHVHNTDGFFISLFEKME